MADVTITPIQNVWTATITVAGAPSQVIITTPVDNVNVAVGIIGGRDGAGGNLKYIHSQTTESAEWIVNHNLGEKPVAEIISTGGAVVEADVLHVSVNQFLVYFSAPNIGQVRCL